LHPDSQSTDKEQLAKIVERLQKESRRLATGVRGGDLRTGRKAAPLSEVEHGLAVFIQRRRQEGATDEQILHEIGETPPGVPSVTMEELERLGGLQLD
jgi:hypothetical protein